MFKRILIVAFFLVFGSTLAFANIDLPHRAPYQVVLKDNWRVRSSTKDKQPVHWYPATIPSTVLTVLVQNGMYHHILDGLTLKTISPKPFLVPWWYQTTFNLSAIPENINLKLNGINYRADIWVNGKQVSSSDKIYEPFRQFEINITPYVHLKKNTLSIKVYPPQSGDLRIGFVDWNPNPPDKNMGITRTVMLVANKGIEIRHPFVETDLNVPVNDLAKLTIKLNAVNHLHKTIDATFHVAIGDTITLSKRVQLNAASTTSVAFSPEEFPELIIKRPRLWWPNKMGKANLYSLTVSVDQQDKLSDSKTLQFGIRKIESYIKRYQEKGIKKVSYYRGFKINGKKVQIRGAAWTDAMLLNNSDAKVRSELAYAKGMNLNAIRLEGFWGRNQTLYNTCDKLGLLVMVGWSAQWEWPLHGFRKKDQCSAKYGCYTKPKDQALIKSLFKDQILWLRNHPSIFVWMFGSDLIPAPNLEKSLSETLQQNDPGATYIISAAEHQSAWNGKPSGVKMRGPYIYEPPVYWFSNTMDGGAFGFNTETGPGAEVPPLKSLKRMLGKPKYFWPNTNKVWSYHLGGHPKLQTLARYDAAMQARYGKPDGLKAYAEKAQLMNYESIRPMFEAFASYKINNPYKGIPATGVFHWMLNAAWPKFFWQLFDYYQVPASAYFSAKEANKPLHVIYNYADQHIYLNNDTLKDESGLVIKEDLWDANSKRVASKKWTMGIKANQAVVVGKILKHAPISTDVYFINLEIRDHNNALLDQNFYWLSKQADVMGKESDIIKNANYHSLNHLSKTKLHVRYQFKTTGSEIRLHVIVNNTSNKIAFFNRFIVGARDSHAFVVPIYWSDNFITLLPHQVRILNAHFNKKALQGKESVLSMQGFNAQAMMVKEGAKK